jgi:hypothetical protein
MDILVRSDRKMKVKNHRWWTLFEIGLFIAVLIAHAYIALGPDRTVLNFYLSDDAYYYFKVAANISAGLGVTFDGINTTNGFHPLWMLINIPVFWLARFDLFTPLRVLIVVSSLLSAGTGILIFRFLRRFILPEIAALTAVFWVFLPGIHNVVVANGLESSLSAFLIILLIYLASNFSGSAFSTRKMVLLGIVAGLTVLARLDNLFIVLLVGLWFGLKETTPSFRNNVPMDFGLFFISGLLAYYFIYGTGPAYFEKSSTLPYFLGFAFVVKPVSLAIAKLYTYHPERISVSFFIQSFFAVLAASVLIGLSLVILKGGQGNLLVLLLLDGLITFAGVIAIRILMRFLYRDPELSEHVPPPMFSAVFWKQISPRILSYGLPLLALIILYMGWNYSYSGTALPVSGQIKRWWGELPHTSYGVPTFGERQLLGFDESGGWSFLLTPVWSLNKVLPNELKPEQMHYVIFGFAGLVLVFCLLMGLSQRKWFAQVSDGLLLFPWFFALYSQVFSYTATSYVHLRDWYWIPEILFVVIGIGLTLDYLYLMLKKIRLDVRVWRLILIALMAYVVISFSLLLGHRYSYNAFPDDENMVQTRFIEDNTEPGSLVGMTGGGTTAYFIKDRTIINLDGLINSNKYFESLRAGEGALFLQELGLEYVCCSRFNLQKTDPYEAMFDDRLETVVEQNAMTLFRFIPKP